MALNFFNSINELNQIKQIKLHIFFINWLLRFLKIKKKIFGFVDNSHEIKLYFRKILPDLETFLILIEMFPTNLHGLEIREYIFIQNVCLFICQCPHFYHRKVYKIELSFICILMQLHKITLKYTSKIFLLI